MSVGLGERNRIILEMDMDKYSEIRLLADQLYPGEERNVVRLLWHCYEFCVDIFHRQEFLDES